MYILCLPLEGEPGVVAPRLIQNNPLHICTFMSGFLRNVFAKIGTTLCIDCIGAKQHKEGKKLCLTFYARTTEFCICILCYVAQGTPPRCG